MYNEYFQVERQEKMRSSFLEIGNRGNMREYPKNSLIQLKDKEIHSITRKFRIVMFQMANMTFSDSIGKVADTLIRLYYQEGEEIIQGKKIKDKFTHEEIAKLIGCSRVTVTRALNKFRDENIIDIVNGEIVIKNIEKLEKYIRWK